MTLAPGTHLGAYEIVAPLDGRGMGQVYRAKDLRLCWEVTIKVLPADVVGLPFGAHSALDCRLPSPRASNRKLRAQPKD